AIDYVQFSRGAYAAAEAEARRMRRGLWAGRFAAPSTWRAEARQARQARPASGAPPQQGCAIKGNISAAGQRIFHVPGQEDYAATRIDPSKGERWFCSAAEAQAAGWIAAAR
ncbi:hypothetical protein ACNJUT_22040, partial [Mycobacterium tuberculosis]